MVVIHGCPCPVLQKVDIKFDAVFLLPCSKSDLLMKCKDIVIMTL